MKTKTFIQLFALSLCIYTCNSSQKQATNQGIVEKDASIEKISEGFVFTEGPAVDSDGNIYFTDQPNNKIWRWSVNGSLSVYHDSARRANGMFFDRNGNLLACADERNQLISINPQGEIVVLADSFGTGRFNGPNDLWPDPKGGIYFTDPFYKRPYWNDHDAVELECEGVYYLTPDDSLIRVIDDLVKPNGITGTPGGKKLYVADIGAGKTYEYVINEDGTLSDKQLFANEGSDGMTIDNEGNIYLTNKHVSVFNADGVKIDSVQVPELPSNVCFGDEDGRTLFITARKSLYAIKTRVKGI